MGDLKKSSKKGKQRYGYFVLSSICRVTKDQPAYLVNLLFIGLSFYSKHCTSHRDGRAVFKRPSKVMTRLPLLRFKISSQFFNQWDAKPKPISPCARDFPAPWASYMQLLGILIGSSRCLLLLWLVGLITLVSVLRRPFENCSNNDDDYV